MHNGKRTPSVSGISGAADRHIRVKACHLKHPLFGFLLLAGCMAGAEAAEGTVEVFNTSGGYGYVTDNETDETYIFEAADVKGNAVQEGDAVTFSVTTADDRYSVKAEGVALAGSAPQAMDANGPEEAADATDDGTADAVDTADAEAAAPATASEPAEAVDAAADAEEAAPAVDTEPMPEADGTADDGT